MIMLLFLVTLTYVIYEKRRRKLLYEQLGAPDFPTALEILKGGFPDFECYQSAKEVDATSLEDFLFTLETISLELLEKVDKTENE
jgi:hypothetical protein